MISRLALLAALAVPGSGPAAAQTCGTGEPCAVVDGEYFAAVPEGQPIGAVLFLHGWGGKARAEIANTGVVGPLLGRGYVVIAPVGLPYTVAEPVTNWNAEKDPASRDDAGFIDAVMDDAADRFHFPRDRVLAAGFSLGGMMVWRLACDAPSDYAAFAPVAGTLWAPLPETCAAPVRLLHFHGWADKMVPLEGRPVGGGALVQGDVFAALSIARRSSGCTSDAINEAVGNLQVRSWVDCTGGASIGIALHSGGHRVPEGWAGFALDWFESKAPPVAAACLLKGDAGEAC